MTFPEFLSWQAYFKAKNRALEAGPRKPDPVELPELGALGPAGIAQAIRGR